MPISALTPIFTQCRFETCGQAVRDTDLVSRNPVGGVIEQRGDHRIAAGLTPEAVVHQVSLWQTTVYCS